MTTYDAPRTRNPFGRVGLRLLGAIDLSENLHRVTNAVRDVPNGFISLLMGVVAVLAASAIGALAFYFDIDASWDAMQRLRDAVLAALPQVDASAKTSPLTLLIMLLPFSLTLLPTLAEMLGARFARFDVVAFQVFVWLMVLFDAITDIPRVNGFLGPYWPAFVGPTYANEGFFGILFSFDMKIWGAALGYNSLWVLILLSASYFLELLAVLTVWAVFCFFVKSFGFWAAKLIVGRIDMHNFLGGGARGRSGAYRSRRAAEAEAEYTDAEEYVDAEE